MDICEICGADDCRNHPRLHLTPGEAAAMRAADEANLEAHLAAHRETQVRWASEPTPSPAAPAPVEG